MNPLLAPPARRYLEAQLDGDRVQALRIVVNDALVRGVGAPDLHLEVIQAAQYEIGRLWQDTKIDTAQEHVATAISQFVMSYLAHYFPRVCRNGKKVLIGCIEGELHEMGPRMCTDFLEMVGFDVRFFGASLPTTSLMAMIERENPDLVGLSVTVAFNLLPLQRAVAEMRARFGAKLKIAAGGQAVLMAPLITKHLGLLSLGKDAREMANAALSLLLPPAGAA